MTWTVYVGTPGGGESARPSAVVDTFVNRLNGVGVFSCLFPDTDGFGSPPVVPNTFVRFVWDDGLASEQEHFQGVIMDVRRHEKAEVYRARGLSLEGLAWQMLTGDLRKWKSQTPHTIIQAAAAGANPNGLIYNSQGVLKPIGITTLQYGTAAGVPWKVDATNPGVALDFRTDTGRSWVNIQRLLLQARHNAAQYPTWAANTYGLEAFVKLEGANNTEPRLYLVGRKERTANHTPETFVVGEDLSKVRRGLEGLTAAEALRVVGRGSGLDKVQSSLVGSGGVEGVITDKTIIGTTNATNQANRLSTLLDPTVNVLTGWLHEHDHATRVGDRITFQETGQSDETLRVFQIGYSMRVGGFFIVAGRPRPLPEDPFTSLGGLIGGESQGTQVMEGSQVLLTQPASGTSSVADGASASTTLNFTDRSFDADIDEALMLYYQVSIAVGGMVDVEITMSGTRVFFERMTPPGASTLQGPLYYPRKFLEQLGLTGTVSSAVITVTNRSGVTRSITRQLSGFVQS